MVCHPEAGYVTRRFLQWPRGFDINAEEAMSANLPITNEDLASCVSPKCRREGVGQGEADWTSDLATSKLRNPT